MGILRKNGHSQMKQYFPTLKFVLAN